MSEFYDTEKYSAHCFVGESVSVIPDEADGKYPFWKNLSSIINTSSIKEIAELPFDPSMVDETPQDLSRETRNPSGEKKDSIYFVLEDETVQVVRVFPMQERIYRVRLSSYDDDLPNDSFNPGRPLREAIQRAPEFPWGQVSHLLWHSEGNYCDLYNHSSWREWSSLEVVVLNDNNRKFLRNLLGRL